MALKVALKFLKNFKILKKLSLKNAILKHFWGFFACFYAILAFRDNRVSPASNHDSSLLMQTFYMLKQLREIKYCLCMAIVLKYSLSGETLCRLNNYRKYFPLPAGAR